MRAATNAIEEATVMYGQTVRVGSRVRHYGQRWTGGATATVIGFRDVGHASPEHDGDKLLPTWVKVLVNNDDERENWRSVNGWDWDRTEASGGSPS